MTVNPCESNLEYSQAGFYTDGLSVSKFGFTMRVHSQRDLERDLNARIDALHYDFNHFEVPHFIHHLEGLLCRQIEVRQVQLSAATYGICVDWHGAFIIFINQRLHHMHQIHTLLHEAAHLILGHTRRDLTGDLPERLAAQFSGSTMTGHTRTANIHAPVDDANEQEAETFVFLIFRRIIAARRLHELKGAPTSIESFSDQFEALGFNAGGRR